jgi:mono/diheme cytochrome c family protein
MRKFISIPIVAFFVIGMIGCNSNSTTGNTSQTAAAPKKDSVKTDNGIGKFTSVRLTHPLDDSMVARGKFIFDTKCMACHKLSNEKLVGPGWQGVTDRRTPEWIMNFITNTNVMLDSDLVAQQLMVVCVTRMPNQNISDDQARAILEYMRKNDGKK